MYQVVDNLSHQAGAHALRAGVDFVFNDDTITYPRSFRGSYTFSSLANFLTGNYSGFTQTFGDPVVSQTNPNIGMYAQDEWRVGSSLTLNLGLRYDLQFLEHDQHRHQQRVAAGRVRVVAVGVAGSRGPRQRRVCSSTACRFAPSPTPSCRRRTPPTSTTCISPACRESFPRRPAPRSFPNILPARLLTTTLVDFTTMDKNLQNAYSKQASVEVERSLGAGRTVSVGYQYTAAARTC